LNPCLAVFTAVSSRFVTSLILLVMLTACQTLPNDPSAETESGWRSSADFFVERRQYTNSLNSWRYSAKVGLSTPDLNEQANLIWEFEDQSNSLRLFGPLGVGTIKLQFDQSGVVLSDNKGLLHRGNNAEQLLTRIVGWPIPIEALSSWMFVLPAIGSPYRYRLNQDQQIERLEQLGWLIQYSDYRDYQGQLLPRKIIASKNLLPDKKVPVIKAKGTVVKQKSVATNGKSVATNGKSVATNGKSVATNGKSVATNGKIVVKLITKSWKL
jgi:outer membrane lipoprotein LolB